MKTTRGTTPALAPDPALPQRDVLLDEQRMEARFSSLIGRSGPAEIESCEKQRIKYRIGESLRVLYRVSVNGRRHLVAVKALAGPHTRAAFSVFPNDRKIKHLSLLRDVPEALSTALLDRWHRSEEVAYVPEKCATVRCQDQRGETIGFAKMYAGAEGRRVYETYLQLASACAGVVKAVGYSEPHRLLLLEAIPGTRIADLKDAELNRSFTGLAKTVASLHSARIPSQLPRFHRHDLDRLRKCVEIIGMARPDVAAIARRLYDELHSRVPPAEPLVCLHGDLHPKNGIALNRRVKLIDLDQSGFGSAAAELGSMLALLHYNSRIGLTTRAREHELVDAFLNGYASARQLPRQESLNWHTAAALLSERALRSVNRIRPDGLLHLPRLLNDARELLETGAVKS